MSITLLHALYIMSLLTPTLLSAIQLKVSSIGDLVPNNQLVQCREWPAVFHNCHDFWRILCEYLYTCGSPADRAGAFCDCAEKWGYPKPIPTGTGNRTFEQACAEELDTMKDALGDVFSDQEGTITPH